MKLAAFLFLTLTVISGCSSSQTAFVTIDLGVPVKSASIAQADGSLLSMENSSLKSAGGVKADVVAPVGIEKIYIAVCEGNYNKKNLISSKIISVDTNAVGIDVIVQSSILLEVPAGDNRKFLVYGVGDDGLGRQVILKVGCTPEAVNLKSGDNVTLEPIMMYTPAVTGNYISDGVYIFQHADLLYSPDLNNWVEDNFKLYGYNYSSANSWLIYTGPVDGNIGPFTSDVNALYMYGFSNIFGLGSIAMLSPGF